MQLTRCEFEEKWLKYIAQGYGHMRAFDMVNEWHRATFGHARYSDYNSFTRYKYKKST